MARSQNLRGIIKFLGRDQWDNCLAQVFDEHMGSVLESIGMGFEDLAEVLGDDMVMILWGCVFEDFLTIDFEVEGGNIVEVYLKRRGWKESAQAKAYLKALRNSVMSLYEVSEIVPGKSLMARDLVRGGEAILVSEGTATQTLKQGDRVAARIVPMMRRHVFTGGFLPFTSEASEMLFDALRRMHGKKGAKKLPAISDPDLQGAASLFTVTWLADVFGRVDTPEVRNAEGEEFLFHDVRFPLASGVRQKDVIPRLDAMPALVKESARAWSWLEDEAPSASKEPQAGRITLDRTTLSDGPRILGNVDLKGRFVRLATNSQGRAEKGTMLIREALGDLARAPVTETYSVEQIRAEYAAHASEEEASPLPPEEAEQVVHEVLDRQYRDSLDQPVPMLGNKTPRQAAKSSASRQEVADWLEYLEKRSTHKADPKDPMATYSFEWMWRELGVLDLRR